MSLPEREKEPFFGNEVAVRDKTAFLCVTVVFIVLYSLVEFAVLSYLPTFASTSLNPDRS